jgi:hypothetical protein
MPRDQAVSARLHIAGIISLFGDYSHMPDNLAVK